MENRNFNNYVQVLEVLYVAMFQHSLQETFEPQTKEDYIRCLNAISKIFKYPEYHPLLSAEAWENISDFVSDSRFAMPDITKEQYLDCNILIEKILEKKEVALELTESLNSIQELEEELNFYYSLRKRKEIKKNIEEAYFSFLKNFEDIAKKSVVINNIQMCEKIDVFGLIDSIPSEYFLGRYFSHEVLSDNLIIYLLSTPGTSIALVRALNNLDRPLEGEELVFLEDLLTSIEQLIKEQYAVFHYQGSKYSLQIDTQDIYKLVSQNDMIRRLLCYLKKEAYQEKQKKINK